MTSHFLVYLVCPVNDEIRNYLSECKIRIYKQISDTILIIEGENLKKIVVRKIIYFSDVLEVPKAP